MNRPKSKLGGWRALLAGLGLGCLVATSHGQEALRLSLAGDLAAAGRKEAANSLGYYNLLLGSTTWRFSSGLANEFRDNVRMQPQAESDLITRPELNAQLHWPVTEKNSLDVSLGVGYSKYWEHADLSRYFISPGSGLAFDIFVGDWRINLHDRLTISENSYENPGTGGNQSAANLENTAGVSGLWDLDKIVINVGFEHADHVSLATGHGQPNTSTENFYWHGGVRVHPELLIGLEAGASLISYQSASQTNAFALPSAFQWNAGVFGSATVSEYIQVRLDMGYTVFTPDLVSTNLVLQDNSGFYAALSLSHRVNRWLNYTLNAGHSTDLSAYGQAQSYYHAGLQLNWLVLKNYSLNTPVSWRLGSRVLNSTSSGSGTYEQYQLGVNLGRQLTQKLSASAGYQFIIESSAISSLNFTANIVSLNLRYQF